MRIIIIIVFWGNDRGTSVARGARRPVVFVHRPEPDQRALITIKRNEASCTPTHAHDRDKGHPNDIYAANK